MKTIFTALGGGFCSPSFEKIGLFEAEKAKRGGFSACRMCDRKTACETKAVLRVGGFAVVVSR